MIVLIAITITIPVAGVHLIIPVHIHMKIRQLMEWFINAKRIQPIN